MVTSLTYLGRVISATNDDWPPVVSNLARAKKVSSRMSGILSREVATPWVPGLFFKAVIQAILLFGSETWVPLPVWARPWEGSKPRLRYG